MDTDAARVALAAACARAAACEEAAKAALRDRDALLVQLSATGLSYAGLAAATDGHLTTSGARFALMRAKLATNGTQP